MTFYLILAFCLVLGLVFVLDNWITTQELKDLKPGDAVVTEEGPGTFTGWTPSGLVIVKLQEGSMIFHLNKVRKQN